MPVLPGLGSVLPGCGPFVLWHGPACGSASVLGCFPTGFVFLGAGYGPVTGGFENGLLDRLSSGLPGSGFLIPGSGRSGPAVGCL